MSLTGRTVFITGASRGIGHAIAMRAAADGANVVIAAKTTEPHPKLPGTIHTAAADVERAGGQALAIATDIRDEAQVEAAIAAAVARFGGIDILVNNASAISLTGTLETPIKRFDLMHQVNVRGTYLCTQKAVPHLAEIEQPARPQHFAAAAFHAQCAMVRAPPRLHHGEVRHVAVRARHGRRVPPAGHRGECAVAAHHHRHRSDSPDRRRQQARMKARSPQIMADAAHWILTQPSRAITGRFFLDDEVLRGAGVTDLSRYRQPGVDERDLMPDFFL